jgi:putative isomerase
MFDNLLEQLNSDYRRINKMMRDKGVYTDGVTGKQYFTGYEYKTLYDWDQYFESIVQLYLGWDTSLIKNGVTIFLDNQQDNGFIWRSVPRCPGGQGDEHVKPFLAQIVMLVYKHEKNLDWIGHNYYERLKKYLIYWLDAKDENKNNLSIWDSAPHTGMDNQHERAGYWYDCFCEGVDLNCYIVRDCYAMAEIAKIKNHPEDAEYFTDRAEKVKAAIQTMWDDNDGLFYDRDIRTGESLKVKYAGIFAVMWAGVATKEQADRMVKEHITNKNEFWRAFPISTYAATEPGYTENYMPGDLGCSWRANTWINVNYYIFEGLRDYGYFDIAHDIAFNTYETVKKIGDREYYTSESIKGCGLDPFWGWSLLAYFMPLEDIIKYDPTKITPSVNDLAVIRVL